MDNEITQMENVVARMTTLELTIEGSETDYIIEDLAHALTLEYTDEVFEELCRAEAWRELICARLCAGGR